MSQDIDDSSENVLYDWSGREQPRGEDGEDADAAEAGPSWGTATASQTVSGEHAGVEEDVEQIAHGGSSPEPEAESAVLEEQEEARSVAPDPDPEPIEEEPAADLEPMSSEHAAGELDIPDGYAVLEGIADGSRRSVAVVAARFNGDVTSRLLRSALDELEAIGVRQEAVTVLVVPGAFELPLAATALAKTRRYACVVALGCVIRGDTPHFDYVASEAASGLQLAALETGVPVSFGVLTLDRIEQADARIEKGAEAVRTALEMADVFSHLRAAAGR
jgi:6,7-dimethyl-8-ribityllumazine synthase